ncbi:uncharacterized protein SAPINGB_P001185 [Magnusiomyces paraingens]|uniref:Amino acid permease/ SLC12A domain-containing protein n=1 Tax=Magnusiomyces paraingens TaxID=2606893 RepID=A0A5E8B4F1_9ASCO|nr:uncharacterized protein SAPINGB_P001185 [Saprochaete ingens]VVT46381.1 unnamed protein product [Saprochaete ingens]
MTPIKKNGEIMTGTSPSSSVELSLFNKKGPSSSFVEKKGPEDNDSGYYQEAVVNGPSSDTHSGDFDANGGNDSAGHGGLNRDLQARHITMIAIGGALGTGLVIGSGASLAAAGPGALLLSFMIVGVIVWLVMCALGEMATWLPLSEGFPGYASRFADPALGFAVGWIYYIKYIIVAPNQLTAAALVIQYWVSREVVNPGIWVAIFLVTLVTLNLFGVKIFGEMEFWLSCIKVVTMLGLIFLTMVIALGGGPDHDRRGFRYWKDPGAFRPFEKNGQVMHGSAGKVVSSLSVMVTAVFAFMGTELVGVTVGEAENPRRNIPRAIKLTFYRICLFYIVSVLFLGMCVPYNDAGLAFTKSGKTGAAASPFVVAITNAGIGKLDQVINAALLLFILSGSNSDMYIATRTLYGLASNGIAPKVFLRVNRFGIPYVSLGFTATFGLLSLLCISSSAQRVFTIFVNIVSVMGLLTWICILWTHICFVKGMEAQKIDTSKMVYRAPLGKIGSWVALVFCCMIALLKNFTAFIFDFDSVSFVTGYVGIPIFIITFWVYKLVKKTHRVGALEIDYECMEKRKVDEEEKLFLEAEKRRLEEFPPSVWEKIYNNSLGYLF